MGGQTTTKLNRPLKNSFGRPTVALHGALCRVYPSGMSQSLRAVRLASGHSRYVFRQPVNSLACENGSIVYFRDEALLYSENFVATMTLF